MEKDVTASLPAMSADSLPFTFVCVLTSSMDVGMERSSRSIIGATMTCMIGGGTQSVGGGGARLNRVKARKRVVVNPKPKG